MENKKKTLFIVDDHPVFRQGIKQVLAQVEWLHIVAEADNGDSAITLINYFKPDIVLLDLALPAKDGLTVLQKVREKQPDLLAIIITSYDDSAYLERSLELGANAFMVKDSAAENLIHCLDAVVNRGEIYISPAMGSQTLELPVTTKNEAVSLDSLTKMEHKILLLVGRFLTSKEIARELGLSYRTIQNHRSNICTKLQLKGPHKLLSFARRHTGQ